MSDAQARLDESPLSQTQIIAILVTAVMGAVDGYDVLAMTFAAPGISREWGIDKTQLGLTLSSGLFGMAIGSFALSPMADRVGRRRVILSMLGLMGISMLLAAFSRSVIELAFCRIIAGLGIGALIPIIAPLAVEYSNVARRRLALAVMTIGFPLGGTLGGFAAAALLHYHRWPSVFLLGAVLSLALLGMAYFWLPEPPAFLLAKRPREALARCNDYLSRCGHEPVSDLPPAQEESPKEAPYRAIFSKGQWRTTATIAIADLLYLMTVYYVLSWMPQLVADLGYSSSFATVISSMAALFGVISSLMMGLISKTVPLRVLAGIHMIGLAITTIVFGVGVSGIAALLTLACIMGIFLYGGMTVLNGVIVNSFSPDRRTTGTGFVMGVGRIAGVITPTLAGILFTLGLGRPSVSIMLSICALSSAALMLTSKRLITN